MANHKGQRNDRGSAASAKPAPTRPGPWRVIAHLCIAVSIIASAMLVVHHFGAMQLPGCGPGSDCDSAAASAWGKVPGLGWPVSFIGLAYFVSVALAAALARDGFDTSLRVLVRVGALVSLGYMAIIFIEGHYCQYCIAAHLGNFGFWFAVERAGRTPGVIPRRIALVAGIFALCTVVLAIFQFQSTRAVERDEEASLSESTQEIIKAAGTSAAARGAFSGRYRLGPAQAPIRIVLFDDYQCRDCKRIEGQLRRVTEQRDDVSLSIKHFPFCTDCNPHTSRNLHENACWAARAVEAAGMLHGTEGFWEMHRWLFDRSGRFTDREIRARLGELQYDAESFLRLLQSPETLALVQADIEEGISLGIWRTPMIFINGVELRGWSAPDAVVRAVEGVAATNPAPADGTDDQPQGALEKLVEDWRLVPATPLTKAAHEWAFGPEDAAVTVVAWGAYEEPFSAAADIELRRIAASRGDVRYVWRQFPMNPECNRFVKRKQHPNGCVAARVAEAAGMVGGSEAFWSMHAWLIEHPRTLDQQSIREACPTLGIDADALFEAIPAADEAVAEDTRLGKLRNLAGVPFIWINDKQVLRYRLNKELMLEPLIEAAAE